MVIILLHADPDPGYVHRGEEKMAEYRNYITNIPHLERPVIHDSCNVLVSICLRCRRIYLELKFQNVQNMFELFVLN